MNDEQLNKLFRAARQAPRDTEKAEYGFETRLLARIRADRAQAALWFAFAWKLVPVFAAIVVALGVWDYANQNASADLRSAIVGSSDESLLASYLTGETR